MKVKRIIYTTLVILFMIIIFLFSGQSGVKSESTSDAFASEVIDKITSVTNNNISNKRKKEMIINTRFIVRKLAHLTIYLCLGILVYLMLSSYNVKKVVFYSILFCFIYACTDEIHQLFSVGRTARFYDIIIDTIGSTIGCFIIKLIIEKRKKPITS